MNNEEFQALVLEKLTKIDTLEKNLNRFEINVSDRFESLEKKFDNRFDVIEKKVDAVFEQTANLLEFKTETVQRLTKIDCGKR